MMVEEYKISETKCRLLVIDDDNYVTEFFGAFFDDKGYEIKVAVDIEEGREEVKKSNYDVLFLDVCLPGADGLEMLEDVKKAVDMGKVVVITGEVTEGLRRRMTSLGIERCLCKPFDLEEVKSIVDCSPVREDMNPGGLDDNVT
jgi:DNA-binding response OmpR family regulator